MCVAAYLSVLCGALLQGALKKVVTACFEGSNRMF